MRWQLVGTIAVAIVGVVVAFVFATRPVREAASRATVVLARGDGVREGTRVTYLGVDFGHVERLAIRDGKVIVELRVHRSDAALRQGDRVRLRTQGIIGDRLLDVVPGPPGAPLLGPGDTLFSDAPSREPSGEA
jgi:ABC-type transporter Mla subunit MlaD